MEQENDTLTPKRGSIFENKSSLYLKGIIYYVCRTISLMFRQVADAHFVNENVANKTQPLSLN